jgi:P-type E1-E2 ATPase
MGLKVVMLTGDSRGVARNIAGQLALEEFVAEVSPEQKLDYILELQRQGEKVGMVGGSVNDALALSIADVGFAMGAGTDIAIESADIALLSNSVGFRRESYSNLEILHPEYLSKLGRRLWLQLVAYTRRRQGVVSLVRLAY